MLSCALSVLLSVPFNTANTTPQEVHISANSCPSARGFVPNTLVIRETNADFSKNQCAKVTLTGGIAKPYNIGVIELDNSKGYEPNLSNMTWQIQDFQTYNSITPLSSIFVTAQNCNPGQPDVQGTVDLLGYGTNSPGLQSPD